MTIAATAPRLKNVPWIATFALGFVAWTAFGLVSHRRESWDDPLYMLAVLPALSICAGIGGWLSPKRAWLIAPALAAGQFVALVVQNPGGGNLWPLTLAIFAVLHLPALCLALLGSWLRTRSLRVSPAQSS